MVFNARALSPAQGASRVRLLFNINVIQVLLMQTYIDGQRILWALAAFLLAMLTEMCHPTHRENHNSRCW